MEKRDARAPGFERRFDREARVVDRATKRRLIAFTDETPFRNTRNRLNDPLARGSDCLVGGTHTDGHVARVESGDRSFFEANLLHALGLSDFFDFD